MALKRKLCYLVWEAPSLFPFACLLLLACSWREDSPELLCGCLPVLGVKSRWEASKESGPIPEPELAGKPPVLHYRRV